jgi:hypothetical protein
MIACRWNVLPAFPEKDTRSALTSNKQRPDAASGKLSGFC